MGTVKYKHNNFSISYDPEHQLFEFKTSKGRSCGYIDLLDKEAIVICHAHCIAESTECKNAEADKIDKCFNDNYNTIVYSMLSLIACAYTFKRIIVTKDNELTSEHLIYKGIILRKDTDKNIELLHNANVDTEKLVHEIVTLTYLVSIAHYGKSLNARKIYKFTPETEQSKKALFKFHDELLWTDRFYALSSEAMDLQFVYVYVNSGLPNVAEEVGLVFTLDAFYNALSKVSKLEYSKLKLIGYELKEPHALTLLMKTLYALSCAD